MDNIIYRDIGRLIPGIFYRFEVHFGDDIDDPDYDQTWIVSRRNPTSDELFLNEDRPYWMRIEIVGNPAPRREKHECPLDKGHVTASYATDLEADIFSGE